jgi:hypothetical protein
MGVDETSFMEAFVRQVLFVSLINSAQPYALQGDHSVHVRENSLK